MSNATRQAIAELNRHVMIYVAKRRAAGIPAKTWAELKAEFSAPSKPARKAAHEATGQAEQVTVTQ